MRASYVRFQVRERVETTAGVAWLDRGFAQDSRALADHWRNTLERDQAGRTFRVFRISTVDEMED